MCSGGSETVCLVSRYPILPRACLLGRIAQISAIMHTFFLAMLLYPDIQVRARHELETALGTHHLPTFEDFGSVPYIDAMIRELLRWQPVARLGKFLQLAKWANCLFLRLHLQTFHGSCEMMTSTTDTIWRKTL